MEPSIAIPGCWTCRLRRKKCSGEKPTCSKCNLLNVPCYRYGPKPSWMDGGAQEKERSNEIRKSVKLTTDSQRRQRALRALRSSKGNQLVDRDDSTYGKSGERIATLEPIPRKLARWTPPDGDIPPQFSFAMIMLAGPMSLRETLTRNSSRSY